MLALNIPELKNFMNQLLCSDTFDHFLLKEATIQKDAVWNFDGTVTPDFYSSEELEEYLGFSVRRLIFVVMFYSATMEISASEFL